MDDSKNPVASDPLTVMLEARGIALVGASPRPGSLGARMIEEVAKSPSRPRTYLVNPRYAEIGGTRCYPGLADLPEPADLALLAVADAALEEQVRAAAAGGARAAVIFGSAVDPPSQLTPRPGPATRQASAARSPVSLASPGAATEARNAFAPNSGAVAAGPGHGPSLRERIAAIARDAGMAVCGAGCMGFVNVARGLRAIGYQEPDPLPSGPAALVTHSGSVFSALLRAGRAFGFTLAVSSGQELVTPAAAYARYALTLPETKVLVLVLEAIRDAPALRSVLADAAARDLPVLLLTAGASAASRSLVAAHSGALASGDGAWQALASAYGVHRVSDLAELADTLELFTLTRRTPRSPSVPDQAGAVAAGDSGTRDGSTAQAVTASGGGRDDLAADGSRAPREVTASGGRDDLAGGGSIHASGGLPAGLGGTAPEGSAGRGIATVHDSGFERAHVADVAAAVGVPFATLDEATKQRLAAVLDPGLEPGNPLDVWGTGRDPEALFTEALSALADDPAVGAVALAVDLVPEYNGDDSYRAALLAAAAKTGKPLTVLASIPAAIDQETASSLRAAGIPVLESTRTGLLALGHLLARATSPELAGATSPEAEPPPYEPHECAIDVAIAPSMAHSFTPHIGPAATAAISGAASDPAGATPRSARRSRWSAALAAGPLPAAELFAMLRDYGIPAVAARSAATLDGALAAAAELGYPVALKTDAPGIAHKSDVGGVRLGVPSPAELTAAYADLSARLDPRVTVTEMAGPGPELILGMARDPALGPLIVVGAGGVFAEFLAERSVALPPLTRESAAAMLAPLRVTETLSGLRGSAPANLDAVIGAIVSFSTLIADVGHHLAAFDLNPVICSPSGVLAVDALAVPRSA